jgi:hypothetical protein
MQSYDSPEDGGNNGDVEVTSLGDQHDDDNPEDADPFAHMTLSPAQIEQFNQVLAHYLELDDNVNYQAEEDSADNTHTHIHQRC